MSIHKSDCAVHNEPAFPKGECDCGAEGVSVERNKTAMAQPVLLTSLEKMLIKWALYRMSTESKGYLMRDLSNLDVPTVKERAERLRSEIELADETIEKLGGFSSVDGDLLFIARPARQSI